MKWTQKKTNQALLALRKFGLSYPGAHKKAPWPGHWDLAVKDKTFAYMSLEDEPLSISCKLPESKEEALAMPGAVPTAYGLGKASWVSLAFEAGAVIPVDLLKGWIDESYRAQAPKKLLKELEAQSES